MSLWEKPIIKEKKNPRKIADLKYLMFLYWITWYQYRNNSFAILKYICITLVIAKNKKRSSPTDTNFNRSSFVFIYFSWIVDYLNFYHYLVAIRNRILFIWNEIERNYFIFQIKYYRYNNVKIVTSFKIDLTVYIHYHVI